MTGDPPPAQAAAIIQADADVEWDDRAGPARDGLPGRCAGVIQPGMLATDDAIGVAEAILANAQRRARLGLGNRSATVRA